MRDEIARFDAQVRASMARHALAAVVIAPVMDELRELLSALVREVEDLRSRIESIEEEKHG
jgi:hypothetical protein